MASWRASVASLYLKEKDRKLSASGSLAASQHIRSDESFEAAWQRCQRVSPSVDKIVSWKLSETL